MAHRVQGGGDGPATTAPVLDMDALVEDLCARTGVPKESARRISALLGAVLAVTADLDLREVLSRIVASACDLVDARYGALGVLGHKGGQLGAFITHGMTAEQCSDIAEEPHGRGVIGVLIEQARPLRLADLRTHPASSGVPERHPVMRTFLGVPVHVRGVVFGNLYLAEKRSGEEFSEEDEQILLALASVAGIAIEHARSYGHARRQRAGARIAAQMTQQLLEGTDEARATGALLVQVCRHVHASAGLVALYDESGELPVVASEPDGAQGTLLRDRGWSELVRTEGAGWSDSAPLSGPGGEVASLLAGSESESAVLAPLRTATEEIGVLVLGWRPGVDADDPDPVGLLTDLANEVSLALGASRSRLDRTRLDLLEERDRIARDMHDHVIQRVFATGLSLQAASRLADHPVVQQRLEEAVEELDEAIKDIRRTIFELRGVGGPHGLSQGLRRLVATSEETLGFLPAIELVGQVDSIEADVASDVLAVTREGLANIARHASAHSARLTVRRTETRIEVSVVDDGRGHGVATARRSGLSNLQERATLRGGALSTTPADGGGTRLQWWVPL